MGLFDWFSGGTQDPQQVAQQQQAKAKSDAALIMQLLGNQYAGGIFGTSPELERLVGNNGGNTLVDNLLLQSQNKVVSDYAQAASSADQAAVNRTVYNALIASRSLAGAHISAQERAQFREQAAYIGNSLPTMAGVMRAMGISPAIIENAMGAAYGVKGSSQQLYNQAVPALSRFVGTNNAARMAGYLTAGQYGAAWTPQFMGGINAQDLGATMNFMSRTGGYNVNQFANGGFGLSYMGVRAKEIARGGLTGIAADSALAASYNQQAVDMAGSIYATEQRLAGNSDLLHAMSDIDHKQAYTLDDAVNSQIGNANSKYGMSISIDKRGTLEAGIKAIDEQFDKAIEKAKETKNEQLTKQLQKDKEDAVEAVQAFWATSDKKDKHGKRITYAQLAQDRALEEQQMGSQLIERTVVQMQQQMYEIEKEKEQAYNLTGADQSAALARVRQMEADFDRYKSSTAATRAAAAVLDSPMAMENTLAVARMGTEIQSAFKQQGKTVTQADALQASKAIAGGSFSGMDLKRFSADVSRTIQSVMMSGGNPEDVIKRMSAFQDFAASRGLDRDLAGRIGLFAERGLDKYLKAGMGDEEAAKRVAKDQRDMASMANSELMRGIRGVEHILGQGEFNEVRQNMLRGMSPEEEALINKIANKRNLSSSDYATAAPILNSLLTRAYNGDTTAMTNMLNVAKQSDYATQQLNRYANADYYWRGSTMYQEALKNIGAEGVSDDVKGDMWSLMLQQADDIERVVSLSSDGSIAGQKKLLSDQVTMSRQIADQLEKNASTNAIGTKLHEMITEGSGRGDMSAVMTFLTNMNEARSQTGLSAQEARGKATREATAVNEERRLNRLSQIKGKYPVVAGKVDINKVLELAGNSGRGARAKAFAEAFGYTDPMELREQLGDEAVTELMDAMILNGNLTEGTHRGLDGETFNFSKDEIEAMKEFAAHPEYFQLNADEAKGINWGKSVNGRTDLKVYDIGKLMQRGRKALLVESGMASLGLSDEFSADFDERDSSSTFMYKRAMLARQSKIDKKQAEIANEKMGLLKANHTQKEYDALKDDYRDDLAITDLGSFVAEQARYLKESGHVHGDEMENRAKFLDARRKKKLEEQNAEYENEKKSAEKEFADEMAKYKKDYDKWKAKDSNFKWGSETGEEWNARVTKKEAEFKARREAINKKYTDKVIAIDKAYEYDSTNNVHYKKSDVDYGKLLGSKAGYVALNTLETARKQLQDKVDKGEATKEDEVRLATIEAHIEKFSNAAQIKATDAVVGELDPASMLLSEEALNPENFKTHLAARGATQQEINDRINELDAQLQKHKGWWDTGSMILGGTLGFFDSGWGADNREWNALRNEKMKLEEARSAAPTSDQIANLVGTLSKSRENLTNELTAANTEDKINALHSKNKKDLDKYGINTGDKKKDLEILRKRYNYEIGNYTDTGKEGEFVENWGAAGMQVGTYEGAQWYQKIKAKEKSGTASESEKQDLRDYERRLAEYIETHPGDITGATVKSPEEVPAEFKEPVKVPGFEPTTTPDLDTGYASIEPGSHSSIYPGSDSTSLAVNTPGSHGDTTTLGDVRASVDSLREAVETRLVV